MHVGELGYLHKRLIQDRKVYYCLLLELNGDPAVFKKGLCSCGWEAQGRLPGRSGTPWAFAEERGFEERVAMGMGEGRAIQSEGSTNGSGVGVEGGHEARGVLLSLESKAARGRSKHVMLHACCCVHVSVLHATGSMFHYCVPSRHGPESHLSCSSSILQSGWSPVCLSRFL